MLRRMAEYDAALERFARPLTNGWVDYELDKEGHLTMRNPRQEENYYRSDRRRRMDSYPTRSRALQPPRPFADPPLLPNRYLV